MKPEKVGDRHWVANICEPPSDFDPDSVRMPAGQREQSENGAVDKEGKRRTVKGGAGNDANTKHPYHQHREKLQKTPKKDSSTITKERKKKRRNETTAEYATELATPLRRSKRVKAV